MMNSFNQLNACSYTAQQMELEVQRVSRELFKAFNGMNAGFEDVSDILETNILKESITGQGSDCYRRAFNPHRCRTPGVDPSL